MDTWDTGEIENSFLSSCIFYLESEQGSPAELCELVTQIGEEWLARAPQESFISCSKENCTGFS
jgi:hypothetical protein